MTGEQQEKIIQEALSWLHTPFHHRGRVKGIGVDCAMLLAEVYERTGMIEHVKTPDYPPDHMKHRDREILLEWVLKYFDPVDEPIKGGIALWKFGRVVSHAAIILDWPTCIHAHREGGVTKVNAEIEIDKSRFSGFFIPKE